MPAGGSGRGTPEYFGIDVEHGTRREDHRALENVLQLTDVSRPWICLQPKERGRLDSLKSPPDPIGVLLEEKLSRGAGYLQTALGAVVTGSGRR